MRENKVIQDHVGAARIVEAIRKEKDAEDILILLEEEGVIGEKLFSCFLSHYAGHGHNFDDDVKELVLCLRQDIFAREKM